ncbi:MAG: threonine--tRNA ligase [Patescibacteria group bacterium]
MENEDKIHKIRHSLAHLLAAAVLGKDPDAKLGVGPVIENGFYYDIQTSSSLSEQQLPGIEKRMREMIKQNLAFERSEISAQEAKELFKSQSFKLELIEELSRDRQPIITYKTASPNQQSNVFIDLCAGPHINSAREINPEAFKLAKIAGAYWRGSEKNPMLTRIYGVAFETKKELDEYLKLQEEAAKKDHRVLGEKLELFTFSDKIGKGLPLWLPKGAFIRKKLEDYMQEKEEESGYQFVVTPHLTKKDLYETSGHLAHYKEDMYSPIDIDDEKYYLKPMNCPHHHMIYQSKQRSYRDLPLRIAEFGTVYRYERSGVLTGLIRTRGFTQNDAHIYCSPEQLKSEFVKVLKLFKKVYKDFGIKDYYFRLSLPDFSNQEKYGDIENRDTWEFAAKAAEDAMKAFGAKYQKAEGEAAFYGPKIDVQVKNVLGKEDTIATVQIDFYMPERFDLSFIDKDGKKQRPIIIHRAIMGSLDRFFAFLIEKYAGALPVWIMPEQVWVLPISKQHKKYSKEVTKKIKEAGIRVIAREENETIGKKIREGQMQKIPYLLIVGDKEMKSKSVAIRHREKGDLGAKKLTAFIKQISQEIENKR